MNKMNIHDEIEDWSAAALCDVLTPDEQMNFEQHLAECPHCRSLNEENQKMNEMLNNTMPVLRPDPNFERRVIAGFREKTSGGWFHPLRGLVWLAQFRTAQAAFTVLILAAMIAGGALLTGGRIGSSESSQRNGVDPLSLPTDMSGQNVPPGVLGDVAEAHFWNPYTTNAKKGVDLLSAPSVTTMSGARNEVSLTRSGTGTLTLTGGNTYTGANTLTAGTLSVDAGTGSNTTISGYYAGTTISAGATQAQVTSGLRSGSQAISGDAIDTLLAGGSTVGAAHDGQSFDQQLKAGKTKLPGDSGGWMTHDGRSLDQQLEAEKAKWDHLAKNETSAPVGRIDYGAPIAAQNPKQLHAGEALDDDKTAEQAATADDSHKLIRNANLDFEVDHFEKAVDTIAAVAGEEQGYINTQNSEKGANGKLQGEIVVKVLPANLDRFLMKLRALGDLKNQTIGTEDVTKDYFDTDARIRNSKRMEENLLTILQKNTTKVSELLQVEKELARVRESIEQMQGQLKYYDALVAYATVTITLREKDLSQPAAYVLRERANLSVFAKDVERAFAEAKSDADAAKAQTIESHIERDADGHVSATLHLLIAPDVSDDAIGKLKALGRIQNFNSQTQRVANNGSRDGSGDINAAKIEKDKVELNLTIQRDEEPAAQQTSLNVLTEKVEEKTAQLKQEAATAGVEVKAAAFNRAANGMEVSTLTFRMPFNKYAAFLEQVKSLGKVKDFTVSRSDSAGGENAPAEIALQIYSQGDIVPDDTGVFATIRTALGEGFSGLMWSARMIGVSLAFIAPWALTLGAAVWGVRRFRRRGVTK